MPSSANNWYCTDADQVEVNRDIFRSNKISDTVQYIKPTHITFDNMGA